LNASSSWKKAHLHRSDRPGLLERIAVQAGTSANTRLIHLLGLSWPYPIEHREVDDDLVRDITEGRRSAKRRAERALTAVGEAV
jgi:hypothetical protein